MDPVILIAVTSPIRPERAVRWSSTVAHFTAAPRAELAEGE